MELLLRPHFFLSDIQKKLNRWPSLFGPGPMLSTPLSFAIMVVAVLLAAAAKHHGAVWYRHGWCCNIAVCYGGGSSRTR